MSIATEISRLQNAKSALATSIGNKGVTVPSSTKLDGYAALVDSIQTGGGGGDMSYDELASGTKPAGNIILSTTTSIVNYAFYGKSFDSIRSDSATSIGQDAFTNCHIAGDVIFPNVTLATYPFRDCSVGGKVVFSRLTDVGAYFFRNGNCKVVELGAATSIGQYVFQSNANLTTIIIRTNSVCALSNTNSFAGTPFASGGSGGTIYVPASLITSYQSAANWATVYGWGATTFAAIEGSIYE